MTTFNDTSPATEKSLAYEALTTLGMVLAALGLVLNALTLVAMGCAGRMSFAGMRVSLTSLCIADTLLASATLAMLGVDTYWASFGTQWSANEERRAGCTDWIFRRLWDVATYANLFTLLFMAGQQFLSVRWPLHSDRWLSPRRSTAALAIAWLTSVVLGLSPIVVTAVSTRASQVKLWPEKGTTLFCYQVVLYTSFKDEYKFAFGQQEHEQATVVVASIVVCSVLLALAASYGYIFHTVRRLNSCRRPASRSRWQGERRILVTALLVTILFLACYLPLFIYETLVTFGKGHWRHDSDTFAALMAVVAMAPVADPLLYACRLKEIRKGFARAVSSCCPEASASSIAAVMTCVYGCGFDSSAMCPCRPELRHKRAQQAFEDDKNRSVAPLLNGSMAVSTTKQPLQTGCPTADAYDTPVHTISISRVIAGDQLESIA